MNALTPEAKPVTSVVTIDDLLACLESLPPIDLLGLKLLEQCQPQSGWYPGDVPMAAVVEATVQLIDYGERTQEITGRLRDLRAIPLTALEIIEYGL